MPPFTQPDVTDPKQNPIAIVTQQPHPATVSPPPSIELLPPAVFFFLLLDALALNGR